MQITAVGATKPAEFTIKARFVLLKEKASPIIITIKDIAARCIALLRSVMGLIDRTIGLAFHSALVGNEFFQNLQPTLDFLEKIRFFVAVTMPYTVYDLAVNISKLAKAILKNKVHKIIDHTLKGLGNVTDITQFVALLVANTAFGAAATFMSLFFIGKHIKDLTVNVQNYRKVTKGLPIELGKGEVDRATFKSALGLSKKDADRIEGILKSQNSEVALKGLKKLTIQRIVSNVLNILANVITIVATSILLFAPPLALVSSALYLVSASIKLTDIIIEKAIRHQFNKMIDETEHLNNILLQGNSSV